MKPAKQTRRGVPVKFSRPYLERLEDRLCPTVFTDLANVLGPVTSIRT